jgi:hypothetical protein
MYELCAETLGCRILRRVATPHIIDYCESLLLHCLQRGVNVDSGELFLRILKDSICLKREIEAKNHGTAQQENFKSVKHMGCLRLNFWLPLSLIAGSWFFDISNMNYSTRMRRNLKLLLAMDQGKSFNEKKTGVKKSRRTFSLSCFADIDKLP